MRSKRALRLEVYLSLAGYDVTIEPDGSAGLRAALTGEFDLLLLDLMLPGVDGFTICRQVREQKKLPILMVSARTGDADKIRGLGFGAELPLKNKGYELLLFLMRHPGQVFSREDLYEMIWGLESMGDNITVAVHIGRIREKLEDDPANPRILQTVWGVGYRLNAGTASFFQGI